MRTCTTLVLACACGAEAAPGPDVLAPAITSDAANRRVGGEVRFGDLVVREIAVSPGTLRIGEPATLAFVVDGSAGAITARIGLVPPRPGSRQVALGGVDAPPPVVPDDPRAQTIDLALQDGPVSVELPALPDGWHPQRALVTLALTRDGDPIAATDGPRRSDGVGLLALVPVQASPTRIVAVRAGSIDVDGALDEAQWRAQGTALVTSLDGEPWDGPPTTVLASWDDANLYVAADARDVDVWSDFRRHDDALWDEEVFEVFVFGDADDRGYLELQVSPRGVTFDARFARHRQADRAWTSTFATAVQVEGTLDDRTDVDAGWTAEIAIPWAKICAETATACPPRAGMELRINAFRFERPASGSTVGLALSPTRVPDFHAVANAAILQLQG